MYHSKARTFLTRCSPLQGYPDGFPTPDPIYLNGMPPVTEAPTKRNVETGLTLITPKPTPHPTKSPTARPITASPVVTLKVMNGKSPC